MPRVRPLVLLGLFLVNQAACYSWQAPKVTPQEYAAQHTDSLATFVIDGRPTYDQPNERVKKMRITLKDEQGAPLGVVVLTGVWFSGDSVFGRDSKSQPTGFSLQQVAAMKVRRVNEGRTALLVVPLVALGVSVAVTFADDSGICCY